MSKIHPKLRKYLKNNEIFSGDFKALTPEEQVIKKIEGMEVVAESDLMNKINPLPVGTPENIVRGAFNRMNKEFWNKYPL